MPKGYSLHIGVNQVDQTHYLGLQDLKAAVQDAKDYLEIAQQIFQYHESEILLDREASSHNIKTKLAEYAEKVSPGDIFLLTYSGHGGLVEDPNFKIKGDEAFDQTWCLYDRQLLDDELFEAFKRFKPDVRVLVISDSCHSGSVTKALPGAGNSPAAKLAREEDAFTQQMKTFLQSSGLRSKEIPDAKARTINQKHADLYFTLQEKYKRTLKRDGVSASIKLFAACQDNQVTFDGDQNGRFTAVLKALILSGKWKEISNVHALIDQLRSAYSYPTPNYFSYGAKNLAFDYNFPFLIQVSQADPDLPELSSNPVEDANPVLPVNNISTTNLGQIDAYKIRLSFNSTYLLQELVLKICPQEKLVLLKPGSEKREKECIAYFRKESGFTIWDQIYEIAEAADKYGILVEASPAEDQNFPISEEIEGAKAAGKGFEYMEMWPPITNAGEQKLGWHLGEDYSQLAKARDELWPKIKDGQLENELRLAHIDTGWWPDHPALKPNPNIQTRLARSFIDGEEYKNGDAIDVDKINPAEQQMHGIGTLGIISGWKVDPDLTFNEDIGYIGAAPFIKTVPIRVTESVIILNPDNIADAIDYAIKMKCEVITMSLGGKPNRKLAKAVNRAYEAGITFVSAAGNSIVKGAAQIGPRTLIFPARYERVIAACGVAQNHYPYDFNAQKLDQGLQTKSMDTNYMQGNWGPAKYMDNAIAAYTPNVPWLAVDPKHPVKKNGGGTSSATPQVATAAALWILKHKQALVAKGYAGTWKQVEAVRYALYRSAKAGPFENWEKFYGRGILQAHSALKIEVPEESLLKKAAPAKSTWAGLGETFSLLFKRQRSSDGMDGASFQAALQTELESFLMDTEEGQVLWEQIEDTDSMTKIGHLVQASPNTSERLKRAFG